MLVSLHYFCCACLFIGAFDANSSFDFGLKIQVMGRGQKATDPRSDKASLVEGHDVGDLNFPPGLGSALCLQL